MSFSSYPFRHILGLLTSPARFVFLSLGINDSHIAVSSSEIPLVLLLLQKAPTL